LFVAFIGFDTITTAAQEAREPQRDVPAGIFGTLAAAAVIYAAVALVLTGLVRYDRLEVPNPVAAAIAVTGVGWVGFAVELGAIAGLSSVLIVIMLGQARILLAMSRDRLMPRALGRVHPGTGAPVVGTIATGITVIALSMVGSLDALSQLVSIGTFLALMIVCVGIPVLRHTDPDLPRSFRVPGSPVVPVLGAAACLYLVLALPHQTWGMAGAWFALGLLVYFGNVLFRTG
jgi:APA family basic amino acid/polyamine antiporter